MMVAGAPRARAAGTVLFLVVVAACSSSSSHRSAPSATSTQPLPSTSTSSPPSTGRAPSVTWASLQNPILRDANHGLKDPALVFVGGAWHALVSAVDRAGHWRIGVATSRDLIHWSPFTTMPHDATIDGEASPDAVRAPDGSWVVTYQSFVHDRSGASPKLYYRTTPDFAHFSAQHALSVNGHTAPSDRLIDAALAYTPSGLLLGYKYGADVQHFEIARSVSGTLTGPWRVIGRPDINVLGDTIENYQFVEFGQQWQLLATSNTGDEPFLFTLSGDSASPASWLHWSPGRMLQVPKEAWNTGTGITGATYEHANGAFFVNRGPIGGFYYLVYEDSPDVTTFGGAGPAVLAIARSRDLATWSVPPH